MDIKDNATAKILNYIILKDNFIDKDTDNYIYASLTAPPIRIVDKNNSTNMLDYTIECPNCGSYVNYGENTYMLSGRIYCDTHGCRASLIENDPYLKSKYGDVFNNEN